MNEAWATIKTNKIILIMNMIICGTLTAGYILDVLKGRMEISRVVIFLAIIALELIVCVTTYIRNKASNFFKYYSLAGYMIIYIYAIFNGEAAFTYVFVFPVSILYVLYYDKKLITVMGILTVILNIAKILYQINLGYTESDDVTSYTVQMAFVILVSIGLHVITKLTVSINEEKINKVVEAQKFMEENAKKLYENINEQVQKSGDIVSIADEIKTLSGYMTEISKKLSSIVNVGVTNVRQLNDENTKVNESSGAVYSNIKDLSVFANDITKIIKIISDTALNTNILSLNASVEAVRSGERNKGFMAVAEEVKKHAEQSNDSAQQIKDIIENLSDKTSKTLKEVDFMIENNTSQNKAINIVNSTFTEIESEITLLVERINTLDTELKQLVESNRDISASTQKIAEIAARSQT